MVRSKLNKMLKVQTKAMEEQIKKAKKDGTWTQHMDEYLQELYQRWSDLN